MIRMQAHIKLARAAGASAAIAVSAFALTACGSGNVGIEPKIQPVDPIATSKLQFAVGVATINETTQNKVYTVFNTVETLRQPDGLSAVLTDTPTITGPPGFSGQPDPVTGQQTNIISGSGPGIPCSKTTFGCAGGAFGYGFSPDNTLPGQQQPNFSAFAQPIAVGNQTLIQNVPYYGGPPLFPVFNNGTFPAGFLGYPPGFITFQTTPVVGSYRLDVAIPTGPGTFGTISATATLNSVTPLPALQPPTSFPDPSNPGGLKIDIVVPSGIVETWVIIQDAGGCYPHSQGNSTNNQFYTVYTTQTGAQQLTVPPNLGPTNGGGSTPTICSAAQNQQATGNPNAPADTYSVYVAGFDYPAFSASYPGNLQQTPKFVGPNGQVDVTLTQPASFLYQ